MTEPEMLRIAIADIDREIESTEERLTELRIERRGAEAVRVRIVRLAHVAPVAPTQERSGNKAEVESILREFPDGLSLSDLEGQAAERGLSLAGDQIRSAVTYLKRRGKAESPRRGHWRLVPPTNSETDADTSVSDGETTTGGGGEEGRAQDAHDPDNDEAGWNSDHRSDPSVTGESAS